jgi:flagellar motor switch protein FliM
LSQAEIDALLNAFDSGDLDVNAEQEENTKQIRDYDFRTANRFHKEQIRTLHVIYDTFSRLFSSYLSGTLRVMADATVTGVEELKYQEFVNALPSPVILAILSQSPMTGPVIFELSPDIAYSMISRLLGGTTTSEIAAREYTEIELVLIERILRQFLHLFEESWEKVAQVKVSLDRIETNPQFAQIVANNETVALVTMDVTIGESKGLINICIPHMALEEINLSTRMMYMSGEVRRSVPAKEHIQRRIEKTPLDLTAVFNATSVTVQDILELSVGDVVRLDHTMSDALTVLVGHLPKFTGTLGVKDKRYAIKVADIIRKEEDVHE